MITVLTSGVALGVHVPGLLLVRRLAERGVDAQVEVLERLLPPSARTRVLASKTAFHRDFRLAVAGHRLRPDPVRRMDERRVAALLDQWAGEGRRRFVVLSGFWFPLLERYAAEHGVVPDVDALHVDSVPSLSFHGSTSAAARDVWLLDAEAGTIPLTIPVGHQPPRPWADRSRDPRVLAHGGGWGIGTYAERGRRLAARGLGVDVVGYEAADVDAELATTFLLDSAWQPWDDDGFPPFGPVAPDGTVRFSRGADHHGSFDLARRAVAMVSKPGGGTLLDSLAAATPVVLTEPLGDHEARNAALWRQLGLGVDFADWWDGGCSLDVLHDLHRNLLAARAGVPSYAARLGEEVTRC